MTDPDGDRGPVPDDGARPAGLTVDEVAALLRGEQPRAPSAVTDRAVGRVRVESSALTLLRTLGGAWLRVGRAAIDLAASPGRLERPPPPLLADDGADDLGDDLEDTGELPPVGH